MRTDLIPEARYGRLAAWLHWISAGVVLLLLASGLAISGMSMSLLKLKLLNWHKWAGVLALDLVLLRLLWRAGHRPPQALPQAPRLQQAAVLAHAALYLLLLATPLLGWAYSSAAGFSITWLGVLPLPDWVPRDRELAQTLRPLHRLCAYALLGLITLHVAAVLKHELLDRHPLLRRMRPW